MEYTCSIGDVYETYTGTPEEILKLIESKESMIKENTNSKMITQNITIVGGNSSSKVAKEIRDKLQGMAGISY